MTPPSPQSPSYPIRAVSRITGIGLDTLRAWERRYGAVVPARGGRGRAYSRADVERLTRLGELVKQGHAIGSVAALSDAELRLLLERSGPSGDVAPGAEPTADLTPLTRALDGYDLAGIEAILSRHALVLPPRELIFGVVLPLLREVGDRWQKGLLRPSQEHLASAVVRNVLGGLLRAAHRPDATSKVLFATPAGERHELGLLCAALLAASAGFGAVYLGPDLPAADIGHAVERVRARVVIVSVTTPGAVTVRELRRLAALPAVAEWWVGGADARRLLDALGGRGSHVDDLAAVVPGLARRAR